MGSQVISHFDRITQLPGFVGASTVSVAAVDSPARARLLADFVCTGVNDEVTIQAAIDSLGAGGGLVQLEEGTYSIAATILVITSGVSILGRGQKTILHPVWNAGSPLDNILEIQGAGFGVDMIEDIEIGNFSVYSDAPYDLTANGGFIGVLFGRIWAQFVKNYHLRNIWGEHVTFMTDTRNCEDIDISHLHAFECVGPAAVTACLRGTVDSVQGYEVLNVLDWAFCEDIAFHTFVGKGTSIVGTAFPPAGIDCGGGENVTINNFVLKDFDYGILVKYEATERYKNISISNGQILNTTLNGIRADRVGLSTGDKLGPLHINAVTIRGPGAGINLIGYSDVAHISDCDIEVADVGIAITAADNVSIYGNRIVSTGSYAISATEGATGIQPDNLQILNNPEIRSAAGFSAIALTKINFATMRGNTIEAAGQHGIYALECKNPVIQGNTIKNCQNNGVQLEWQSENYVLDAVNRILGFTCDDNLIQDWGLGAVGQRGVFLTISGITGAAYNGGSISRNQFLVADAAQLHNGIRIESASLPTIDRLKLDDNLLENITTPIFVVTIALGSSCTRRNNTGFRTENSGTAVVANGTTSIVVNHSLDATPTAKDISVTPTNNLGNSAKFWLSGVGATQFTINVDADPGATTATFAWSAQIL